MRSDSEIVSPKGLRSPSSSSDVLSTSGRSLMGGVLPQANPSPAYIAQGTAEHLVSTELDRPVTVSDQALDLVNGFLDQLLYNLLALSKSTALDALRQAVPRLLRPRLGSAAMAAAEEELRDYFEEEDPENLQQPPKSIRPSDFDIELAWKLARLRCMVYARLGDMEEEDEEEYLESERLEEHTHNSPMSVYPMSAIFLTSVLEFLGEQALCGAAQQAERRQTNSLTRQGVDQTNTIPEDEDLVVEAADVMHIGREGPLSRLWRSWRRDSRALDSNSSRPITPGYAVPGALSDLGHARSISHTSPAQPIPEEDSPKPTSPSQIPLPMRETDVDEIEVPGLAPDPDARAEGAADTRPGVGKKRPSSLLIMPGSFPIAPAMPSPDSPTVPQRSSLRPAYHRQRSQSLPTQQASPIKYKRYPERDYSVLPKALPAQGIERVEAAQPMEPVELEDSPQTLRPDTQSSHRTGAINGAAVAALAGALGVEAERSRSRQQPDAVRPETPPNRGIADREVSDPEDLALSSADEGNAEERPLRDSGFAVAGATGGSHASPRAVAASPTSPRRNREAAVYENSIVSSPQDPNAEFGEMLNDSGRPGTRESVRFEPSELAQTTMNESSTDSTQLPFQKPEDFEDGTPNQQDGAWSTIPPRMSSRDQPHYGHTANLSKTSNYSQQHSKSSSASSKLLGFARDQNGRPLKEQRVDPTEFNRSPHSRSGSGNAQRPFAAGPGGGSPKQNLAARRGHLRVRGDSEEDAARTKSLEILIKSDETLHYTLTPKSARAEEFPETDTKPKTETQDLADFFRTTGPPGDTGVSGHSRSAKPSFNGLRSNPPESGNTSSAAGASRAGETHPAELSAMPTTPRKTTAQQARDPRPERNTTRDLADYVRSTGPTNDEQLPQALATRPEPTSHQAMSAVRPTGSPRMVESRSSTERANRLKYQARDARPQKGSETADLIDFIRQGPPRVVGDHRIDRRVAPFRSTMDSDDLRALAPSDAPGRDSVGSTHESGATRSMQESTNSRTALLESNRQPPTRTVPPINHDVKRQIIPEQDGMPPRTHRRIRDPYAIDVSDDDEMEEDLPKSKPRNEEESLIDFLRNTAPPPGMTTQPILAASTRPQGKTGLKHSSSNSRMRDMLSREGSKKGNHTGVNGAREDSPHLYQRNGNHRPPPSSGGAGRPKPKFEARGAKTNVTSTSDLADYLKNSGPAESTHSLPSGKDPRMVHTSVKEQAGFMKFFSRKGSLRR